MFTKKITCSSVFVISVFISYDAFSQLSSLPKWEAGINAGAYIYQGDLTPHRLGSIETIQPGIGISGTRIINSAFSARLLFNMARLAGNESKYKYPGWRQQRNFSFSASVKELTLSLHWNVFGTNYDEVKYEPYLFAGAGASFVNITRNYSKVNLAYFGEKSAVQDGLVIDAATPTPRVIPVMPVGAGVRYHISDRIVLNLEVAYRLMRTDYLDGFSQSANPSFMDHYSSITVGAAYKFGNKEKYGCPVAN
jgi:opacity protein-like surface antigen